MTDYLLMEAKRQSQELKDRIQSINDSTNTREAHLNLQPKLISPQRVSPHHQMKELAFLNDTRAEQSNLSAPPKRQPTNFSPSGSDYSNKESPTHFDSLRDDVQEILNRKYSPKKLSRSRQTSPLPLPGKRSQKLLILKIERQNIRLEDLEASARQLRLENQHLEISKTALQHKMQVREDSLAQSKKNIEKRENQLRLQVQQLQRKIERLQVATEQEPISHQHYGSFPSKSNFERIKSDQIDSLERLELENELLRKELHEVNLKIAANAASHVDHVWELQSRLQSSLDIIRYFLSKEQKKDWDDYGETTEELLMGDSLTMELLKQFRITRYREKRISLRIYGLLVVFLMRLMRKVRQRKHQD